MSVSQGDRRLVSMYLALPRYQLSGIVARPYDQGFFGLTVQLVAFSQLVEWWSVPRFCSFKRLMVAEDGRSSESRRPFVEKRSPLSSSGLSV